MALLRLITASLLPLLALAQCPNNVTTGSVFSGPTRPSAYDLLKRNSFVTRKGISLDLLGKEFRMVGPNIYWLGTSLPKT
jgi:hypothetical protein